MSNPKIEVLPIEKGATPDPANINKHTQRGRGLHENSMRKRGAGRSIFSAGKGVEVPVVMGGNQTLEIGATLGMEVINVHTTGNQIVNVVRDDIAPGSPEFYALGIEDNEVGKLSYNPDIEILAAVMADPAMQALKDEDKMLAGIVEGMGLKAETQDAAPQIDRAAELLEKWQVKTGDLWQIGEHRLICGSSLERDNVSRLFGDLRARLIWTDPPYGVNYGEKMDSSNPMGYRVRTIENDDLPPDELEVFIRTALQNAAEFSVAGAAIYVASPAGTLLPSLIKAFDGSGFDYRWGLIWLKDQIVLSRADYHFKHENLLYGWKSDGAHFFIDDRKQASVFEYPRPKKSEEHPTMKPVELVQHMIRNSSEKGDVVYDCFGGSGTTMLASENEGRICRIVELSPAFCSVQLERMSQTFPGLEIKLIDNIDLQEHATYIQERKEIKSYEVPDTIYPTNNEYDIPVLRLDMQAPAIELPSLKWGQQARGRKHAGTYHFYTDDYKFSALWSDPTPVINSGCPIAVEINFSIHPQAPKAIIIEHIYKKRWISRYWQENGVQLFVDLGVPPELLDVCCLGVPSGWRSFATRVYESDDFETDLLEQYKKAVEIKGNDDVIFVVFGKSEKVKRFCIEKSFTFVKSISF